MKLGRNDPCHCGSGQKYKKCCLAKDEAARAANLAEQVERREDIAVGGEAPAGGRGPTAPAGAPTAGAQPRPRMNQPPTPLRRRSV